MNIATNFKLIGIHGVSQAGKSTAAEYLWERHGFVTTAFADRLKDVVSTMFGWDRLKLEDQDFKAKVDARWGFTPREALQLMGTEAVQGTFGKDFWIKAWRQIYNEIKLADNVVVADVRFEHEADEIRAQGGTIVHLVRMGLDTAGIPGHSSEAGIRRDPLDYIIINGGTVEDLYAQLDGLVMALAQRLEEVERKAA